MIIIESSYSGKPVLSEYQLKMMSKYTENVSLKEFLDSKFALIGGKTATHARPKSDSALYQEYFKKYSKVTDIAKDLGILYDLNMLCGSDGGFAAPIKGYKKSDIARSLIPDDATFQCTSKVRPFYVRFSSLSKNKYAIYVKEDMLDASRFADSTPQNSSDTNMSLKEMLANKLQEQIRATDTYKYKYVLAVSESNPIMSIRDMNYVTEVHWINRQGQCDSIAAITTNKDINKIDKIENYIRCGTSIKNIGDTKLPTKLPATFESNIDTYFRIIERVDISAE